MMENLQKGLIVKALGGFYYVQIKDNIIECRARGIFRKKELSPVVGDYVTVQKTGSDTGTIEDIIDRKNYLIRPPLANLDYLLIVTSICDPIPNTIIIDKLIAISEYKQIEPIIIITKNDLEDTKALQQCYEHAGFTVFSVNYHTNEWVSEIKQRLKGCVCAFVGNTGVGKSSFLNVLCPDFQIKTAQISQKLGRGKHTTRHVEFYYLQDVNTYIADTPGFSSIDMLQYDLILKDDLQYCFREFEPFLGRCKFTGCSHTVEKGCAVLEALQKGEIESSRHKSYLEMYQQAKNIKEWELK